MALFDWTLVVVLNASIVLYGVYLARGTRTSEDWFLAGRSLPWWMVGLSLYATAIDSSDLVADSGGTYSLGMSYFPFNWVGVVSGWVLAAFFICPPMIRAGMYTNAEYLEARFGVFARVVSVIVQVQYRTLVLAIIGTTLFLVLNISCDLDPSIAWGIVVVIAALASLYTAMGGLRSVAVTDCLQFGVMSIAALVFWILLWSQVGSWAGIESKLAEHDPDLPAKLLHVGSEKTVVEDVSLLGKEAIDGLLTLGGRYDSVTGTISRVFSGWLVALSMIISGLAYAIVNHTQTMRLLAARSKWDLRMSVSLSGIILIVFAFVNLSVGIMGRALHPEISLLPGGQADAIFPLLLKELAAPGLIGLLVAGVMAAALSTYDSIGSTLAALLTRDVYARLIVKNADERHYLRFSQWITPVIIGGSFLYVPYLDGGMLLFYLDLTASFVVPLLTLYLMGVFTSVHPKSGAVGLIVGGLYGVLRLIAPKIAMESGVLILPAFLCNTYVAYPASLAITAGSMILYSVLRGEAGRSSDAKPDGEMGADSQSSSVADAETTRREILPAVPAMLAIAVVLLGLYLSFVLFW